MTRVGRGRPAVELRAPSQTSADSGDHAGRQGVQCVLGVAAGEVDEHVLRGTCHGVGVLAGAVHGRVDPEQGQRLAHVGVVREVAGEQRPQPCVTRIRGGEHVQDGQGLLALAQVGPRPLAGLVRLGRDVDEVVGELEGDAEALAVLAHRRDDLGWAPPEHGAVPGGRRDEHAGLVGQHVEVVVDRVGAGGSGAGIADLAGAEPHEGLGLDLDRTRTEVRDDVRGGAEEQVADEDRRRVAVGGVRARGAAPQVGLVHDVVVVEGGEGGPPHTRRGGHDAIVDAATELGRQQSEQRPEPLATGGGEGRGGLGDEGVLVVDTELDEVVDGVEAIGEPGPQPVGGTGQLQHRRGAPLRRFRGHRGHRRNSDAELARSRASPGMMPATTVTSTPTVMATVEGMDGTRATTSSPVGSVKYMSTMRRTYTKAVTAEARTPMTTSTVPVVPDATAGAKAAYFAVNPDVSGIPAKARRRKANVPATTGCRRPRPAHWDRCDASEPPCRTIATMPKAETVMKPYAPRKKRTPPIPA